MPQLRQNIVTGEWTVVAPERSKRPSDFIHAETIKTESKANCAFCIGGSAYQTRLPHYETPDLYVIPNKYPAFVEDPTHCSVRAHHTEDGFYNLRPATGGHDVLAVKEHDQDIYHFSLAIWTQLFELTRRRYRYWRQDCNTQYSMLIYNQGVQAGASISHPHAQIFASNIIPNHINKELFGAQHYFDDNGTCVFCELVQHEQKESVRIIAENNHFVAFTFYAARFPFETWIIPKHHCAHYEDQPAETLTHLGEIMKNVVGRLGKTLHNPPLNFFIHDLPTTLENASYYHWHLEITPRVSTYGGFELGGGTIIDVMSPEEAAGYLQGK